MTAFNVLRNLNTNWRDFWSWEKSDNPQSEIFRLHNMIMHNVYCEEMMFDQVQITRQLTDDFLNSAECFVVFHKPTKTAVATGRIIVHQKNLDPLYPSLSHCNRILLQDFYEYFEERLPSVAEISSFAIIAKLRRYNSINSAHVFHLISDITEEYRGTHLITPSLCYASVELAKTRGVKNAFFQATPAHARLYSKILKTKCSQISVEPLIRSTVQYLYEFNVNDVNLNEI